MAELLKQQHSLVVLQLSLDRSFSSPSSVGNAIFSLEVSGSKIFETRADCAEMGLPKHIREARKYRYSEPTYTIPEAVVQGLKQLLPVVLDSGVPLWLQLSSDCGILTLVPWERLLQPRLQVPMLRLPYYALKPFSPGSSSLHIVLCASTPVSEEAIPVELLLDRLTRRLLDTVQREVVVIHVFADALVYKQLMSTLQDRIMSTNGKRVQLYNPFTAPTYTSTISSSSIQETLGYLENPWLLWIIESLRGQSADVIHFVCHGYLSTDQGTLAFAESPARNKDREWARFAGAQQLTTFLTHLGTSAVGFSSPENNYSEAGLRILGDQIARLQAGAVLVHEVKGDDEFDTLAETYSFLFDDERDAVLSTPALALYCHPSLVEQIEPQPGDINQESLLNQFTLAKGETLKILESKENTPTWIASSQRFLENSVAELISTGPPASSPTPGPAQQGVEEALGFVSDVLMRHASSSASDSEGKEGLQ